MSIAKRGFESLFVRAAYTYFASCGALYYLALLSPLCSSGTLIAKAIQRRIMPSVETELVPLYWHAYSYLFILIYAEVL